MRRFLALLLCLALLPWAVRAEAPEDAGFIKDEANIAPGVAGIAPPVPPADKDAPWSGHYVYFGAYDGKPVRFRVLAKDATAYTSGKALFLDSDEALFDSPFDDEAPYTNSWNGSSLQKTLNGPFLAGFDAPEQAAVALSTGSGGISWPGDYPEDSWWGPPVSVSDRVFLLDHAEVRNEAYGYSSDNGFHWSAEKNRSFTHPIRNHRKGGSPRTGCWVLRTASAENSENRGWHVLAVKPDGCFLTRTAADAGVYRGSGGCGVAPCLNVDQAAILLSTRIAPGEFKLTLLDGDLTIAVPAGETVSVTGSAVTVPWEIGGPSAGEDTLASVLILDGRTARETGTAGASSCTVSWRAAASNSPPGARRRAGARRTSCIFWRRTAMAPTRAIPPARRRQ